MGTKFREGDKPKNNVTIGRGGTPPTFDAETGERQTQPEAAPTADRSFAQPNPVIKHEDPQPKTHASEADEQDAIRRNSTMRQGQREKDSE